MLEVREMRAEDLQEVARIERETFSQPWSEDGFARSLEADNTIYLTALADGKVVGYCGCQCVLDEAEITNVAVAKNHRGQGIAFRLLTRLLQICAQKGVTDILLEVRQSNQAAIRLYEKAGFAAESERKNFYEQPREDAVIMWHREGTGNAPEDGAKR